MLLPEPTFYKNVYNIKHFSTPQKTKLLLILCFIQFTNTRSRTSTYVSDIVEIELFWNSDESWKTAQTLPQGNMTPFICKFFT